MIKLSFKFAVIIIILLAHPSSGNSAPWGTVENISFNATTTIAETAQDRASVSVKIKKNLVSTPQQVTIQRSGAGDYDTWKNITWKKTAQGTIEEGYFKPTMSTTLFFDKDKKLLASYIKDYNYEKKKVTWLHQDTDGNTLKEITFPLKGKTCDDTTVLYFTQAFIEKKGSIKNPYFYLLTNGPKLYKLQIEFLGEETLELPAGNIPAEKVKLVADIGILDNIFGGLITPTYIWYQKKQPHQWLQYQGFEKGYNSTYIKAYLATEKKGPSQKLVDRHYSAEPNP